ncbi:carbohydrate ABC transporter permease [Aliiroseovarius crassostreae]|uniref:carbohydrate ABC transporter permease n=1 Tax=Aliiroseovarius crassostreae TaxID=154981 RepID=UPI002208AF44|nr:carbohydrate ABC transporter permease [Aliiroseovarius crassostreae]UWQ06745.1 carbohydrate ABC transporter permease [Aliiroseovarius crassostreae]
MRGVSHHTPLRWVANSVAVLLVLLWIMPTLGLLVSSLRDRDAVSASGWWTALQPSEQVLKLRAPAPEGAIRQGEDWVLTGNLLDGKQGRVLRFGLTAAAPSAMRAGQVAVHRSGYQVRVEESGDFVITYPVRPEGLKPQRIFVVVVTPPQFTAQNYLKVLRAEGMGQSFVNTLTVTLPSTILPVLIAAFAAYALTWMDVPGRPLLLASIVGLLVVPLQVAFIPLLSLYSQSGLGKSYPGIWLAHTGFGLPFAIFLLRAAMARLPAELIEAARLDGAGELRVFYTIVLPLIFPALAGLSIFQFLWVWNDLLVARVFLGVGEEHLVMTGRIVEMMGTHGGEWELLAASAFVSMIVPLLVFFVLQRCFIHGLLSGAVARE